ncbi:MAG: hypothetical protein ABSA57_16740 [Candidatus Acidiferrales bacterium]
MNPLPATAFLAFAAALLFALPLLPAIAELRKKHDAQPLRVNPEYAGDIRHFARGFRSYADALRQPLQECVAAHSTATGKLHNGDRYLVLGDSDNRVLLREGNMSGTSCPLVVVAGIDLALPPGLTFLKEIYACGQFIGGAESTYRAICGEKGIHLQHNSKVTRWVHAAGDFEADRNCDLYGRASSDGEMSLHSGCFFQRLNAPRIATGSASVATGSRLSAASDIPTEKPVPAKPNSRRLIEGDWEIQSGAVITENIVTRGSLRIGSGVRIAGSAKSSGEMVVGPDVVVEGSLISAASMHIGPRGLIGGPVIAERAMVIESGTQCGSVGSPTTVSAPLIDAEEECLFFGTLWAREHGHVVPKP